MKKFKNIAVIVLCLCLSAFQRDTNASTRKREKVSFANKWAICIGVNDFRDETWNMKYAVSDAEAFHKYLVTQGKLAPDHVKDVLRSDASTSGIKAALSWLDKMSGPNDVALIYIRTRGTYPELDPHDKIYLATSDSDPKALSSTAIPMDGLLKELTTKVHAGALIVVADADFADVIIRGTSRIGFPPFAGQALTAEPGANVRSFAVVASAGNNEICWESDEYKGGVFTHALLQQLTTCKESSNILECANSIRKQVAEDVQKLHPNRSQRIDAVEIRSDGSFTVLVPSTSS